EYLRIYGDGLPMTPIGHIGITLPIAYVLRLNLPVAGLCTVMPDIVDKPLEAVGIGDGRYIAHTLVFVALVTVAFSLWKRVYGLAALLGGVSHLLLDWVDGGIPVPWFYPFVDYGFPEWEFDPHGFFSNLSGTFEANFILSRMGKEMIWVAVAVVTVLLCLGLYRWYRRRCKQMV
ncbi:MAG: metal-dependent hydrolase, partial [Chloroflexota bacterium]|nr:metal-dependent hydrolase [Chloroflexota bacterium]